MKLINKSLILTLGMALTLTLSACSGCSPHTWSSESSLSSVESSSEATIYQVTFNANGGHFTGGDEILIRDVKEGECVEVAPNPTLEYADFMGWFEEGSSIAFDFSSPITNNVNLFAKWLYEAAEIISSEIPNSTLSKEDREINVSVLEPDRNYLSIVNRLTLSDGATYVVYNNFGDPGEVDPDSLPLVRIYNSFNVRVTSKSGHFTNDYTLKITKTYNVQVSYYMFDELIHTETVPATDLFKPSYIPDDPVGYYFSYWSLGGEEFTPYPIPLTKDVAFYAHLDERFIQCTVDANGGVFDDGETSYIFPACISWQTDLKVPTYAGHRFLGYFLGDEQITDETGKWLIVWHFFDDYSATILAHWEQIDYMQNIKVREDQTSWWTIGNWPDHIYYGETYVLPIPCKEWLRFTAWYYGDIQLTDNRGNCLAPWTLADDITYEIYPEYEEADFTVNYYLNGTLIHTQVESLESYRNNFDLWVYETDDPIYYGWSTLNDEASYLRHTSYIATKAWQVTFDYFIADVYAWTE